MIIVSIDPGRDSGVFIGYFDKGKGKLKTLRLGVISIDKEVKSGSAEYYETFAYELNHVLEETLEDGPYRAPVGCLICEKPQIYRDTKGKNPNDLLPLEGLCATAVIVTRAKNAILETPAKSKGQTPKPIDNRRKRERLKEDGYDINSISRSKQNHALDAFGLGVWAIEKGKI